MKFLLVDNEVIAHRKSYAAEDRAFPNRHILQAQRHAENPSVYPATCQSKRFDWKKDELGRCELEIKEEDEQYVDPADINELRNERAIEVAQGPK